MTHDPTKVVLGSTQSSFKTVDNKAGSIDAGKVAVQKSDGTITTTLADGSLVGVSLGKSLSDTARMAIVRRGAAVPILIDAFTPTVGAQVQVHATSGIAVASGTAVNAFYASSTLTGVKEDGTTANCALIDFPGGL
jgi:hypothetical protein